MTHVDVGFDYANPICRICNLNARAPAKDVSMFLSLSTVQRLDLQERGDHRTGRDRRSGDR